MSATMTPAAEAARMIDSLGPEALTKAQGALGKAEDEWLELEALRETIEG